MNEMRVNMLKRRENLKRQRQQSNYNPNDNFNQKSTPNEPLNKMPRLSNAPDFNHGTSAGPRKPSRWEKSEENAQPDGSSNDSGNRSRRPGDWDCIKCDKLQFAFRNSCKFCGLGKEESEKMRIDGKQMARHDNTPDNSNSRSNAHNNISTKSLFQTREDLKHSTGN